jgi:hypothetical protein
LKQGERGEASKCHANHAPQRTGTSSLHTGYTVVDINCISAPKRTWKLINNEMGNTKKLIDNIEIKHGLELITNSQVISDNFNYFFINTIVELKSSIKQSNPDYTSLNYNFNSSIFPPLQNIKLKVL